MDCAAKWPSANIDTFAVTCFNRKDVTEVAWSNQSEVDQNYDPQSAELCNRVQVDFTARTFTFNSEDFSNDMIPSN